MGLLFCDRTNCLPRCAICWRKLKMVFIAMPMCRFLLPKTGEPLAGLENLETAREQLKEYQDTLKRWKEILAAIEQREILEAQLKG